LTIMSRLQAIVTRLFIAAPQDQASELVVRQEVELAKHLDDIANLKQETWKKVILYINLAIILAGAFALYVFFSINPFTLEEIEALRAAANLTTP
jgi:hypothetical protein